MKKILYIEDNEMVASTVYGLLVEHGYQVDHFPLGKPGFEHFCQDPQVWDLVILDLDLPDLDGQDLIPQIAASRPGLPILVFSGKKGLNDSLDLYAKGATAVVAKPFGGYDLLDVIKRVTEAPPA